MAGVSALARRHPSVSPVIAATSVPRRWTRLERRQELTKDRKRVSGHRVEVLAADLKGFQILELLRHSGPTKVHDILACGVPMVNEPRRLLTGGRGPFDVEVEGSKILSLRRLDEKVREKTDMNVEGIEHAASERILTLIH
jgi:hypothetical protein